MRASDLSEYGIREFFARFRPAKTIWKRADSARTVRGVTHALTIDFVAAGGGLLAVTHRPKMRSLPEMRNLGVTHLVTLLSEREGARDIGAAAQEAGLEWRWVELADADPPPPSRDVELLSALTEIAALLHDRAAMVVHCSAGVHRTGMFTYALLRRTGLNNEDARRTLTRLRAFTAGGVGEHRLAWGERLCGA